MRKENTMPANKFKSKKFTLAHLYGAREILVNNAVQHPLEVGREFNRQSIILCDEAIRIRKAKGEVCTTFFSVMQQKYVEVK